jgi:hypothetical protein
MSSGYENDGFKTNSIAKIGLSTFAFYVQSTIIRNYNKQPGGFKI